MNNEVLYKNESTKSYIEWFLPYFFILQFYNIANIKFLNFSMIGLFVVAFLSLYRTNWVIKIDHYKKMYFGFMFFVFGRDVIRVLLGSGVQIANINNIISYLWWFFLVFAVTSLGFSENTLFKSWKVCTILVGFATLYHCIVITFLGQNVQPITIIPGYVLRESLLFQGSDRPLAFFSEPGGIATCLMPMLFLSLKRQDYRWSIITTLIILASTSTTGVFLAGTLWLYALFMQYVSLKRKITVLFLILSVVLFFLSSIAFEGSSSKLFAVLSGESTFNTRVVNGFEIIKVLDTFEVIFGTNTVSVYDFVSANLLSFSNIDSVMTYYHGKALFLNTIAIIVFHYGIIGLFYYLYLFVILLRDKNYDAKAYVVVSLLSAVGQSVFLNATYFGVLIIILLYTHKLKTPSV